MGYEYASSYMGKNLYPLSSLLLRKLIDSDFNFHGFLILDGIRDGRTDRWSMKGRHRWIKKVW
ncbi:hypothetical protein SK128_017737, partial [Halocaridina rubra]